MRDDIIRDKRELFSVIACELSDIPLGNEEVNVREDILPLFSVVDLKESSYKVTSELYSLLETDCCRCETIGDVADVLGSRDMLKDETYIEEYIKVFHRLYPEE